MAQLGKGTKSSDLDLLLGSYVMEGANWLDLHKLSLNLHTFRWCACTPTNAHTK